MNSTTSPGIDGRWVTGFLLMALFFLSLLSGLKNLVLGWTDTAEDTLPSGPPGVLFIVADDLGYDDTTLFNSGGLSTPSLERLARLGTTFRRHYADSTCSPSRVAMLSGRYPERSGFRPNGSEIPAEHPTLAEQLKLAGYTTYLTGKWHAGEERRQAWPDQKGFDHWFGFLNQFETSGEDVVLAEGERRRPTYNDPMLRRDGGEQEKYPGHLTDILTGHSVERLKAFRAGDKPWFLYHGFLAPHTPIQPARRYREQFPDTLEGKYTALVTQMDDAVGRLLDTVDLDNTLVIFVSDNGGPNSHRDNNFPFFGKKNQPLEGAYRTPMVISWPGKIPAGQIIDEVVMNVDLYPTVLEATGGIPPEGLDGSSLLALMTKGTPLPGNRSRSWESYHPAINALSYSVLSGTGEWRQSSRQGAPPNLFNLLQDSTGATDVAAGNPDIVGALSADYRQAHWDKARINVTEHRGDEEGQTLYRGFDVLRTPYQHGFAIGLEVGPLQEGDLPKEDSSYVVAEQERNWTLRYKPGQGLEWQIGASVLRDTTFDPSRCNAVILTGYFQQETHLALQRPMSVVKLYAAGYLQDLESDFTVYPVDDAMLAAPTKVNFGSSALFSSVMLSSYADPYDPRTDSPYLAAIKEMYREKQLTIAEVGMMNKFLCTGSGS